MLEGTQHHLTLEFLLCIVLQTCHTGVCLVIISETIGSYKGFSVGGQCPSFLPGLRVYINKKSCFWICYPISTLNVNAFKCNNIRKPFLYYVFSINLQLSVSINISIHAIINISLIISQSLALIIKFLKREKIEITNSWVSCSKSWKKTLTLIG